MITPYEPIEDIQEKQRKTWETDVICGIVNHMLSSDEKCDVWKVQKGMVKTASSNEDETEKSETKMTIKANLEDLLANRKIEASTSGEQEDARVSIISKDEKDPHFEIFVEIADMEKNDILLTAISYLCKEHYLGRYLIKRNLYFLRKNRKEAKQVFGELIDKTKQIRQFYYDGKIISGEITKYINNMIQNYEGDFVFQHEEQIGTNQTKRHANESEVYQWFYRNQNKMDEIRKIAAGPIEE